MCFFNVEANAKAVDNAKTTSEPVVHKLNLDAFISPFSSQQDESFDG